VFIAEIPVKVTRMMSDTVSVNLFKCPNILHDTTVFKEPDQFERLPGEKHFQYMKKLCKKIQSKLLPQQLCGC
jgi:hypothetical protein